MDTLQGLNLLVAVLCIFGTGIKAQTNFTTPTENATSATATTENDTSATATTENDTSATATMKNATSATATMKNATSATATMKNATSATADTTVNKTTSISGQTANATTKVGATDSMGLSTGAIVGIAVGGFAAAVVAVAFIILIVKYFNAAKVGNAEEAELRPRSHLSDDLDKHSNSVVSTT